MSSASDRSNTEMPPKSKKSAPAKTLEQTLWDAADKMRGNLEAAEYKHIAPGLVFLKYVSDAFEQRRQVLVTETSDPTARALSRTSSGATPSPSWSIDWNLKESVRAAMRAKVRRLLAKYDYPLDKEERAIELVLEQAEVWAAA